MNEAILQMENISKKFPGVKALNQVDFDLKAGEVHGLVGENGAGKTTLMNILGGIFPSDSGTITFKGNETEIQSPLQAQEMGIAVIHQEPTLLFPLTVKENIYLQKEPKNQFGLINWKKSHEKTREICGRLDISLNPDEEAENLSAGEQQMVEIVKALSMDAEIIVMDEPTSSLTAKETNKLFNIIDQLRHSGKSIIYISHHLNEVFDLTDRVSVLRNGNMIETKPTGDLTRRELVRMMVGRELEERYFKEEIDIGKPLVKVKNLSISGSVTNISFTIHYGEIVGIAGLIGSGRSELLEGLYGVRKITGGSLEKNGHLLNISSPTQAVQSGIMYLPKNRDNEGLFLKLDVKRNISAASLEQENVVGFIQSKKQETRIQELVRKLHILTPNLSQLVRNLSGGNKQKVMLGKCLKSNPSLILMNEPTRGIDVGAKIEIYELMFDYLRIKKGAVLMSSSEIPELLNLSDKILVMYNKKLAAIFDSEKASRENIMHAMTGGLQNYEKSS